MIFWEVQKSIDSKNLHLRMRKIIPLLFVCISSNLIAQKSFFGANAGANLANQRTHIPAGFGDSGTHYYQNSLKPTFGVFYQYGFNEKMGLRLNAQYMGLGYKDQNFTLDINYLTLPLTFHYSLNKHLSFNTGPYLSFTLGGTKLFNEPITKTYHKNDHGLNVGGEYNFYKNLSISISYIFGLKSILLDDSIRDINGNVGTVKVTNRALQFTLIYKFKKPLGNSDL
jgi:hypothetical protein